MTRIPLAVTGLACTLLLCGAAATADPSSPNRGDMRTYPGIPAESTERFGGKAAMDVWAQDLNYYILGDNRINQIFHFGGNVEQQKAFQDDIEAMVLGLGVDPAAVAAKNQLQLTMTQYNAVVENMYLACEASRTRYQVCNKIVASLAPFERAAVTR
jgi:hemoglobin